MSKSQTHLLVQYSTNKTVFWQHVKMFHKQATFSISVIQWMLKFSLQMLISNNKLHVTGNSVLEDSANSTVSGWKSSSYNIEIRGKDIWRFKNRSIHLKDVI